MELEPAVLLVGFGSLTAIAALVVLIRVRTRRGKAGQTAAARRAEEAFPAIGIGLTRTRRAMWARLLSADAAERESLGLVEEALLGADVGVSVTRKIVEQLQAAPAGVQRDRRTLRSRLATIMMEMLSVHRAPQPSARPHVVFVVGVNGVGKTTSVAKLAYWFRAQGRSVLIVGADTFRAAATEQLKTWAQRVGVELVTQPSGADPAAVVHDGLTAAVAREVDVVLVDTAGRLHAKKNLMEELRKMIRIAGRVVAGAPHDVWLVLDATVGQNGLSQARTFSQVAPLTGVILTKLDGTAKGGVVFAISDELGVPIRFVGTGEGLEDLQEFDPRAFVQSILWEETESPALAASAA